jgi:hypothetical protein
VVKRCWVNAIVNRLFPHHDIIGQPGGPVGGRIRGITYALEMSLPFSINVGNVATNEFEEVTPCFAPIFVVKFILAVIIKGLFYWNEMS